MSQSHKIRYRSKVAEKFSATLGIHKLDKITQELYKTDETDASFSFVKFSFAILVVCCIGFLLSLGCIYICFATTPN